jgi:hypothetical protein
MGCIRVAFEGRWMQMDVLDSSLGLAILSIDSALMLLSPLPFPILISLTQQHSSPPP